VVNTLHAKMDLPLVLLESLLLGVPVMVGAGTPAETLGESGGAEVLPTGDGAALAARITALRDDSDRRAAMAASGARWVRQHCAPSTVAGRYESLYDSLRADRGNVAAAAVPR
jgi:glycosyltransferase involved in cell wall biosynthesis